MAQMKLASLRLFSGVAAVLVLLATANPQVGSAAPKATDGTSSVDLARSNRIAWGNGSYFLSGVNYPFYRYYGGDIATLSSVDGSGNVTTESAFDAAAIEQDFVNMQAGGVHTLRWFLFGDGRGAPEFDRPGGKVTGLDSDFLSHMDQVMAIAQRHNIYIIWSVWDFLAFEQANWLCGGASLQSAVANAEALPDGVREQYELHLRLATQKEAFNSNGELKDLPSAKSASSPDATQSCLVYAGGHRNLVTDTAAGGAQDSFFNNAMIPILQHMSGNKNIIGWEVMNEPEWTINDVARMGQNPTVTEPVALAPMRAFFQRFTAAVHQYAPGQLATVGSAALKWMGAEPFLPDNTNVWQGLGFDYYGVHYYGWMESQYNHYSPLQRNYNTDSAMQRLDAPVVVGEFPINGGSPPIYLPNIRRQGSEESTLHLRYICTAFLQGGDPPCTRAYTATIEYYNPAGDLEITQNVTLQPGGNWSGTAPVQAGNWTGSARIIANGPIAADVTQDNIADASESVSYVGQDSGASTLYLPEILNISNHQRTRIALQNTTISTANISVKYYYQSGELASTDNITLGPRGMTLLDPEFINSGSELASNDSVFGGPPFGFQGSAVVQSDNNIVGVVYELGPSTGSDAYTAVPESYGNVLDLPSIRNWGADGDNSILLQNARGAATTASITYYNAAGVAQSGPTVNIPAYGSVEVKPSATLPGGFVGSAVINSGQTVAAVVRSTTTAGSSKTLSMYAANPIAADRFHFANVAGGANNSTLTAQNINPTKTITVVTTFNADSGASTVYTSTIAPMGTLELNVGQIAGANFSGSAEVLWPWVNGWNEGFPLLAVERTLNNPHTRGDAVAGVVSHAPNWAVTPYTPSSLLSGIYNNNWAGAMGWSYYDGGTGVWDDYAADSLAFSNAHQNDVNIGGCQFSFSDVHSSDYFYTPLNNLYCDSVISGYSDNTFRPFNNTTRGQLAKIVVLATGLPIINPSTAMFNDVSVGSAFFSVIETAAAHGIISGYNSTSGGLEFRPNNNVTRSQLAKIIVSARGWQLANPSTPTFTDVATNNPFYQQVETAVAHGIISGYDLGNGSKEFRPGANATRGQIGKIVYLAVNEQ